ncbi:MAG: hypothetical protein PHI32_05970 [Dysgonamonadaceae bacterium]|nr:hypothetical protein [Dysgonamonadaceae bacterium]
MRKVINPQAIEIQRRFFQALEMAIQDGVISGIQGFCKDHNLNRVKYQRIKTALQNPGTESLYKIIDLDALLYICKDYNVSPEWLLLGRGEMRKE